MSVGLFNGWERVIAVLLKTVVLYGYVPVEQDRPMLQSLDR